jgi:hypothetical protein
MVLEFSENITGREDCTDCPFMPESSIPLEDINEIFDFSKGEIHFLHCPVPPASTYRLRLRGFNLFDPSRPVVSPEMFISMP